jgi:DMSO reductase anchor subunit
MLSLVVCFVLWICSITFWILAGLANIREREDMRAGWCFGIAFCFVIIGVLGIIAAVVHA